MLRLSVLFCATDNSTLLYGKWEDSRQLQNKYSIQERSTVFTCGSSTIESKRSNQEDTKYRQYNIDPSDLGIDCYKFRMAFLIETQTGSVATIQIELYHHYADF